MPETGLTVIARSPQLLLRYAEQRGLDSGALMQMAGLSDESLIDPDARIPLAKMRRLWRAVISQIDDEILGLHAGQTVTAKEMGLLGYAMYHSADLHCALRNLSRYGRLVSEAVQYSLEIQGDMVALKCRTHPFMVALRHPVEAMLAIVITVARELTENSLRPERVRLPSSTPTSKAPYRRLFDTTVEFETEVAEIVFTRDQMRRATNAPDSTLKHYLTELADAKVRSLDSREPDIVDQVHDVIWASLPDSKPDLPYVAAKMRMSPRTLQRRLRKAGTSYSDVLDEFRRNTARELRENRGFASADVAFLLGYAEPSSYQRAVRRWREMSGI